MGVGDHKAFCCGAGGLCLIAFGLADLLDGVDYLLTCGILIQPCPGVGPLFSLGKLGRIAYCFFACIQLDLDALGTDAVLVIAVFPGLRNSYVDLLGRVGVGDGEASGYGGGDACRVVFNSIFCQ